MTASNNLPPQLRALVKNKRPQLSWYHALGRCMRELLEDQSHGQGIMDQVAEPAGLSRSTLYRTVKFAQRYRAADLPRLRGLSWTQVSLLLPIPDAQVRDELVQAAQQNSWSYQRLREEVKRKAGYRPGRGGKPARQAGRLGLAHDLDRLQRVTEAWLSLYQAVWKAERLPPARGTPLSTLAEKIKGVLGELDSLTRAAETLKHKLKDWEKNQESN